MTPIEIHDPDRDVTYHLSVSYSYAEDETGCPSVDVDRLSLDSCVVWLAKCGMEVKIDPDHLRAWTREIERTFGEEIELACIEHHTQGAAI